MSTVRKPHAIARTRTLAEERDPRIRPAKSKAAHRVKPRSPSFMEELLDDPRPRFAVVERHGDGKQGAVLSVHLSAVECLADYRARAKEGLSVAIQRVGAAVQPLAVVTLYGACAPEVS